MIPFSGKCPHHQYIPSKPSPVGLKNFVMAAPDGVVLDFKIYTGKGSFPEALMKEIGLGASVVKEMTARLTKQHCIYTARFFTSHKTIDLFLGKNIYQVGTDMRNRMGPVANKIRMDSKMIRGQYDEWVRADEKIFAVSWMDNKPVLMMSSYVGSGPVTSCQRWSKSDKRKITIEQPAVVNIYNQKMGGVDLCDRYMSYYRCNLRTKKNGLYERLIILSI